MKQVLLFASAIALMTSCAKTELGVNDEPKLPAGISFQASAEPNAETKAQWTPAENQFHMFWYAETDKISVAAKNAKLNNSATGTDWTATDVAEYKATQSKGDGQFTAIDGTTNMLTFDGSKEAEFRAIWPVSALTVKGSGASSELIAALPSLSAQDQTSVDGAGVVENVFMYSKSKAKSKNPYDAVGEKLDLRFVRPLTAMVFKIDGYEQYKTDFSVLKTIKLEMLGKKTATDTYDNATASYINYGTAFISLEDEKMYNDDAGTAAWDKTAQSAATSIELKLNGGTTGLLWKDGSFAYMAMNKVDRSKLGTEGYKITYTFDLITFTKTYETANNWPVNAGNFVQPAVLDINAEKYLVTNVKNSSDRTLIINSGTLSEILTTDKANVKWNATSVPITEFAKIVANVALTNDELALLKGFTNVTDITLAKNTEIPSKTFVKTDGTGLQFTSINMPLVTEIANDAFIAQSALSTVKLASYSFANTTVRPLILVANQLKSLDMSAVMSTAPEFPGIGFQLKGFTALVDITVMNGLKVGSSTFDGCKALTTVKFAKDVKGSVEIVGINAFKNCEALTAIAISNSAIFTGTFEGCKVLAKIVGADGVKAIQPTSIAAMAFKGCAVLTNIDLSQAATIGEAAFKDCVLLEGGAEAGAPGKVLRANAIEVLADEAFSGCKALKYVGFANVTKVGKDVFGSGTSGSDNIALTELKFAKAITSTEAKPSENTFGGTISGTTLFVNAQQVGVKGSTLVLQGTTAGTSGQTSFVFGTIN